MQVPFVLKLANFISVWLVFWGVWRWWMPSEGIIQLLFPSILIVFSWDWFLFVALLRGDSGGSELHCETCKLMPRALDELNGFKQKWVEPHMSKKACQQAQIAHYFRPSWSFFQHLFIPLGNQHQNSRVQTVPCCLFVCFWSGFRVSVESNPRLYWFCLTSLGDWSRKLPPLS